MAAYPIWLDALARVVSRTGVHSVGLATEPDEAIDLISELDASLFVMDAAAATSTAPWSTSGPSRRPARTLRVILVGDRDELELVERAFDAGVFAYLLRSADPGDLEATVRQAFSSSIYLASGSTRALRSPRRPRRQPRAWSRTAAADPSRAGDPPARRRRTLQRGARAAPLGHRADGEVPPLERLPQAQRLESHRGVALGPAPRAPGRAARDQRRRGRRLEAVARLAPAPRRRWTRDGPCGSRRRRGRATARPGRRPSDEGASAHRGRRRQHAVEDLGQGAREVAVLVAAHQPGRAAPAARPPRGGRARRGSRRSSR